MLELCDISVQYGAVKAVSNVSLELQPGQLTVLNGHHGAGKSSLLKAIVGAVVSSGNILLSNQKIQRRSPNKMAGLGVILVPEGRHQFPTLTTRENLEFGPAVTGHSASIEKILTYFPDLKALLSQPSLALSGGQAQMVAMARVMLCSPKYLLLDEPLMGLSQKPKAEVWAAIQELRRTGVGILVAGDHNVPDDVRADQYILISNSHICEGTRHDR